MTSYFRGCALRLLKQVEPAKSQLIRAAGMHGKPLSLEARRAVPYALVVLGEMYLREFNQLDNAARFFSKAQNYKVCEFVWEMMGTQCNSWAFGCHTTHPERE